MNETPLVSICVLTYNHEKYIRKAMDSFLMQKTNFPFEIVIHDDASTDRTADIIREYEKNNPGMIYPLLQTENQYSKGIINVSGAYNYPRARGKYIAFCDGDDFWKDENKLQKQVDYMEQHEECSLCFHAVEEVSEAGEFVRVAESFPESRVLGAEEVIRGAKVFPFVSFLFRRKYVENLPAFYYDCPVGDLPIQLIMADSGSFYYMNEPMACYRLQSVGSWTSTLRAGADEERKKRLYAYIERINHVYRLFDEYTKGKYAEAVNMAIRRNEYDVVMEKEDFKGMLKKEYRPFFEKMPFQARLGARIGAVSPWLYGKLRPKK